MTSEVKVREVITVKRMVTVKLDPAEYVPVTGDRKPGGGHRVARLITLEVDYGWSNGAWEAINYTTIRGLKEQQKVDGSWSEPVRETWPRGISRDTLATIEDKYRPTATVSIEVSDD